MAGLICSDVTRRARHGIFLALLLSLSTVASAAPKADPLRVATRLGVVEGGAEGLLGQGWSRRGGRRRLGALRAAGLSVLDGGHIN